MVLINEVQHLLGLCWRCGTTQNCPRLHFEPTVATTNRGALRGVSTIKPATVPCRRDPISINIGQYQCPLRRPTLAQTFEERSKTRNTQLAMAELRTELQPGSSIHDQPHFAPTPCRSNPHYPCAHDQGALTNAGFKITKLAQQVIQQTDRLRIVNGVIGQRDREGLLVVRGSKVFCRQPKA